MRAQLIRLLLATLVLSASGCSSDPEEKYCDQLDGATAKLVDLADRSGEPGGGGDYVAPALELLQMLREEAPDELRDEWDTFVFAWQDLADVLDETGVDATTFDPKHRPRGLSDEDFERVRAVGEELRSPRVRDAVEEITRHAHDVCGLSLDL